MGAAVCCLESLPCDPCLYGQRFLLHTDHTSLIWLLNFKDSLSHRPCERDECHYCLHEEDQDARVPMVAALYDIPPTDAGRSGSVIRTDNHDYEDLDKEDL